MSTNLLLNLHSNLMSNVMLHCNHHLLLEEDGEIRQQGAGLLIKNQLHDTP